MPQDTANHTPLRRFRTPDDPWDRAAARAEEEGITMSDMLRMAVAAYGDGKLSFTVANRRRATVKS